MLKGSDTSIEDYSTPMGSLENLITSSKTPSSTRIMKNPSQEVFMMDDNSPTLSAKVVIRNPSQEDFATNLDESLPLPSTGIVIIKSSQEVLTASKSTGVRTSSLTKVVKNPSHEVLKMDTRSPNSSSVNLRNNPSQEIPDGNSSASKHLRRIPLQGVPKNTPQKQDIESTSVQIDGNHVALQRGSLFYTVVGEKVQVVMINKLWRSDGNVSMECSVFNSPAATTSRRANRNLAEYAEDELVLQPRKMSLQVEKFVNMVEKHSKLPVRGSLTLRPSAQKSFGSASIKTSDVTLKQSKNAGHYIQSKYWENNIDNNISAQVILNHLDFGNDAGDFSRLFAGDPPSSFEQPYVWNYGDYCKHRTLKKALEVGAAVRVEDALQYKVISEGDTRIFFSITKDEKKRQTTDDYMDRIDDEIFKKYTTDHEEKLHQQVLHNGEPEELNESIPPKKRRKMLNLELFQFM